MGKRWIGRLLLAVALAVAVPASAGPALLTIPSAMAGEERRTLESLAREADVSTRVDSEPFVIRREVFEYLLDHPDFATSVSRALKYARYRIWRTPDGLAMDDGYGTTGRFWVAHAADGVRVMRARGTFRKGVLPAIHGEAATMIEYTAIPRPDGTSLIRSTVSGVVRLDSRMLAMAFRVAAALAQKKADREASKLMTLFARVSRDLDRDPVQVYDRLRTQPDVPAHQLEEFRRLLAIR